MHARNPGDELNKLEGFCRVTFSAFRLNSPTCILAEGKAYGYPYCFTEYDLGERLGGSASKRGEQWAWPVFMNDGEHNDLWCRDLKNNQPPVMALEVGFAFLFSFFVISLSCFFVQPHAAALGMAFYPDLSNLATPLKYQLPDKFSDSLFVAYHGDGEFQKVEPHLKIVSIPFLEKEEYFMPSAEQPSDFLVFDKSHKYHPNHLLS